MDKEVVAVFIPIIMFMVTGLVIVTSIFFRSKERQLLIEKGIDAETIKALYNKKKIDSFILAKIGIILFFFGLGLGFGLMIEEYANIEFWIPFLIFTSTGIGFFLANLYGDFMKKKFEK
ncbi:MAG: hypothetical protein Q8903_02955 [Bacteroidota bacterium]|nr:hypothetical protein [Bacteroidota bacterium]